MKITIEGYASKINLRDLQSGWDRNIRLYKGTELHHLFGDKPEEDAVEVRVTIEEVKPAVKAVAGMTNEKCLELMQQYREYLTRIGVRAKEVDYDALYLCDKESSLRHCLAIIPKMEQFIQEGRREKFFRWLGFMQGVFHSFGLTSLNGLRDHNRPPE